MKKRTLFIIFTALICFSLLSCSHRQAENGKLKIVTTLFPHYDFAQTISGSKAQVTKLLPWGSESHTYDPSIKDITMVTSADLFLYTGELEPWAASIAENAEENGCTVVDISKGITLLEGVGESSHEHDESSSDHIHDFDPHVWTDPGNAAVMVDNILVALCNADPENSEYYRNNANALKYELSQLSDELLELSEKYKNETLYFGGRFAFLYMFEKCGFSYVSPYEGCGEESEPSIKTVTGICSLIKSNGIKYIFREEMSEGKIALGIAEETGAEPILLHSCHNLSKDEAKAGETYIGIMRRNINAIEKALASVGGNTDGSIS